MKKDEIVKATSNMFQDYFAITLPDAEIWKLLDADRWLRKEVKDGCVTDTMVRDVAIELFCRTNGIPNWPMYGDTNEYKDAFYPKLKAKVIELGGKFNMHI